MHMQHQIHEYIQGLVESPNLNAVRLDSYFEVIFFILSNIWIRNYHIHKYDIGAGSSWAELSWAQFEPASLPPGPPSAVVVDFCYSCGRPKALTCRHCELSRGRSYQVLYHTARLCCFWRLYKLLLRALLNSERWREALALAGLAQSFRLLWKWRNMACRAFFLNFQSLFMPTSMFYFLIPFYPPFLRD